MHMCVIMCLTSIHIETNLEYKLCLINSLVEHAICCIQSSHRKPLADSFIKYADEAVKSKPEVAKQHFITHSTLVCTHAESRGVASQWYVHVCAC